MEAMRRPIRQATLPAMSPSIRRLATVPIRQRGIWMEPIPARAFHNPKGSVLVRFRATLRGLWTTPGGRRLQTPAALRPVLVVRPVVPTGRGVAKFSLQNTWAGVLEAVQHTAPLGLRRVGLQASLVWPGAVKAHARCGREKNCRHGQALSQRIFEEGRTPLNEIGFGRQPRDQAREVLATKGVESGAIC